MSAAGSSKFASALCSYKPYYREEYSRGRLKEFGIWIPIVARLLQNVSSTLKFLARGPVQGRLNEWSAIVPAVAAFEPELQQLADTELRKRSLSLRYRAKSREPLETLLPEAYALVREAAVRTVGMRHFDVQILGGIAMHHRCIAEMQTGEGKTLTATLPLYLHGLAGKGVHLATVNDYLAERDAQWMGPIYRLLGMTVGIDRNADEHCPAARGLSLRHHLRHGQRIRLRLPSRSAAAAANRLKGKPISWPRCSATAAEALGDKPVQRPPHFALVDEADSVLIDEARTPLIIGALPTEDRAAKPIATAGLRSREAIRR